MSAERPVPGARPETRQVTIDLLDRYDQPGPRYTSYPTAVEFHEGFTAEEYERRLAAANAEADAPLSLYVHLPFCEDRCLFCGCHVIITPHREKARPYLDLLRTEIGMVAERLPDRRSFAQLHLGGGTPTYFSPEELSGLVRDLKEHFRPTAGAELAAEVDPRVTTEAHIDALADHGFNRLSMGVQDLTPEVQEAVNRLQPREAAERMVEAARRRGMSGTNMDLIYGLPGQTPEAFEATVEAVIDMGADRCAVYSFAFVPWIRGHQKKMDESLMPDRNTKFSLFAIARERFLRAGYEPIGMDHFAKPDDELARAKREGRLRRNFQGYTVLPGDDVIGLGISSIGDVQAAFVQNQKKLNRYEQEVTAGRLPVERGYACSDDDRLRRRVIHELMCNFRVDFAPVEAAHGITFRETFAEDLERLKPYADEGLAVIADDHVAATPTGELFARNPAMCFDRYWREKHEGGDRPVFSRTV